MAGEHAHPALARHLAAVDGGDAAAVYLIAGELTLAEAAAAQLAERLAAVGGATATVVRRPTDWTRLLGDLLTRSLFEGGRVIVAVDSAVVADRGDAAGLLAEAASVLPLSGGPASAEERAAASRLIQLLHLCGIDPHDGEAVEVVERLPGWVLGSGRRSGVRRGRGRGKASRGGKVGTAELVPLLELARLEGLRGTAENVAGRIAELVRGGLPRGHALVLVERLVDPEHPLVALLREAGTVVEVGSVAAERRGGWSGLDALAAELAHQTGSEIHPDALAELARRTLRQEGRRGAGAADAASTARLAAEYRKLAHHAAGEPIELALVAEMVEDRGEEDAFGVVDALALGRRNEAVERLGRLLGTAEDPLAAALSFLGLLATFCRQLVASAGAVELLGLPAGERSYARFRDRLAPALTAPEVDGLPNPVAGAHPYPLHRAYLAGARVPRRSLAGLPARLLEAELGIKGEASDPTVALTTFVAELAAVLG